MNLNRNDADIIHTIIYIFCKCVNHKRCGHVVLFIPDVISDHLFSAAPPGAVISEVAPVVQLGLDTAKSGWKISLT